MNGRFVPLTAPDHDKIAETSTTPGLPVSPALGPALESIRMPQYALPADRRVVRLSAVAVAIALAAGLVAQALLRLIGLVTNLAFYGRLSADFRSPADNHLGWLVVLVPALGGLVVGFMARFGSRAIRGHGIPEAMERVLLHGSRIPPRLTFLKPLSAAIAIGTGGPFGAEGPIIATGGALGSFVGQLLPTTANERKVLLASGAAAGMAATFGSPISAVLLAIELLLFEFRPRSVVPVALASGAAAVVRTAFMRSAPIFAMPPLGEPAAAAVAAYTALGAVVGVAAVAVTRAVYAIEDAFERLPIHWMWWPALGGLVVGLVGFGFPATLGVGYDNVDRVLTGRLALGALASLCLFKLVSWSVSLSSGTSGGTLAPLFTIGGAFGALLGRLVASAAPGLGVDPRIAGLVGMAAMFAGASRALLASIVFAFETTLQPVGIVPLLCGCTASYLVSTLLMRETIMTEKIARRGIRVPTEYTADPLAQIAVGECASRRVVSLPAEWTVEEFLAWIEKGGDGTEHHGFPVLDPGGRLVGIANRRELLSPGGPLRTKIGAIVARQPLVVVFEDNTLREAADLMVRERAGRLPVVRRDDPRKVIAMLSRSDVVSAGRKGIEEMQHLERSIRGLELRRRRGRARDLPGELLG